MITRETYAPGAAAGARVQKEGERWTLILVRDLRHAPQKVWDALTDPAELHEWAPFDSSRNLGSVGPATLTTARSPGAPVSETIVTRAEPPKLLEYNWGENEMRWELEAVSGGTRLTLWHNIGRKWVAMGAAGWHICFDVLDQFITGNPIGRIVGGDAMSFEWKRLNAEYSTQFNIEETNPQTTK
jgi:uncharacterized protein YndB with AHSA1/START domain